MFQQVTIILLFAVFAYAGIADQRWSYEDYLKELAQLHERFQVPENVSKEEPSINSLHSNVSLAKSDGEIQKEHVFSEQKTTLSIVSGKELEKSLDTKVQPLARIQLPDDDSPFRNFSDANDTESSIFCDDVLPKVHTHLPAVSKLLMALSNESDNRLEEDINTKIEPTNITEASCTEEKSVDVKKEKVSDEDCHKSEEIAINQKGPSSNALEQGPAITCNTSKDEITITCEDKSTTATNTKDESTTRQPMETTNTTDESTTRRLMETTNSEDESTTRRLMETTNGTVQSMNFLQFEFQPDDEDLKPISRGDSSEDLEEEVDFRCPTEFGFFPDTYGNCSLFYACHGWKAEKRMCADGKLHFNPITRVCDHPAQALCELECPQVNGRFPVPGYCDMFLDCNIGQGKIVSCPPGLHFNAITKLCDKPSKVACDVSCPSYSTLMTLPGRCNMYVSCENRVATYHICPTGLQFNPITLKCDWPDKAGCEIQCLSPDGYFPVLGQCGTYVVCRDGYPKIETCPSGLHFNFLLRTCDVPTKAGCELKCEKPNGYFPFPGVCSYYIKCIQGTPSLHKCPGDLEFNTVTMQCDFTKKNHCMPRCPADKGVFPVPNHCDLYLRCSNGQPIVKRCPSSLHFNALFKECDTPERAKCQPVCSSPSGLFPILGKCNMFFRCENNTATVQSCAYGLHFNVRTQTCDWPASAHCEIACPELDGFYPVQGECNVYVMCSNGHPILRTCSQDKHFNFETKRCDSPKNSKCKPTCPTDNGKFPLAGHCDSYVYCQDGKPYQDSCPPGLFFSRVRKMCDLPENVSCNSDLY